MKKKYKNIISILLLSTCLGLIRNIFSNEPLELIKKTRILNKVYSIPELMLEPLAIDISFAKNLYDNKKAIFLDARDKEDFKEGHIFDAINIPYDDVEEYENIILQLDPDFPVVIYCSGGECDLSVNLADLLYNDYIFSYVLIFESGYPDWVNKRYPVE